MTNAFSTLPLSLLLICGCYAKVRTDMALLSGTVRPGTRILCVGDFSVVRWHNQGVIFSPDDSVGLGAQYLDRICDELKRKGYAAESLGVADINWPLKDGSKIPVVRGAPITYGKYDPTGLYPKSICPNRLQYDSALRASDEVTPLNVQSAASNEGLRLLVRALARKIDPKLKPPVAVMRQSVVDKWRDDILREHIADPAELQKHARPPGLLLIVWGAACAANEWQVIRHTNVLSMLLQAVAQAGMPVVTIIWREPVNSLLLRCALVDPKTGRVIWFSSHVAMRADMTARLRSRVGGFVRDLLVAFPEAKDLGGTQPYGKSLFTDHWNKCGWEVR